MWVRRRSSGFIRVIRRPIVRAARGCTILENRDRDESENEQAWESERAITDDESIREAAFVLLTAAASAMCVELVFSDAELWQLFPTGQLQRPRFGWTWHPWSPPSSVQRVTMVHTSHQHGSTSETPSSPSRSVRAESNYGSKRRQRHGNHRVLNLPRRKSDRSV